MLKLDPSVPSEISSSSERQKCKHFARPLIHKRSAKRHYARANGERAHPICALFESDILGVLLRFALRPPAGCPFPYAWAVGPIETG